MALSPSDHDLRIDTPWNPGQRAGMLLVVALVPALLVLDFAAGRGMSLHLFYLFPVALAAWSLGARAGYAIALATGASWAFIAISSHAPGERIGPVAWDVVATFALFLFVAHLVARHRRFVDGLHRLARVDAETGALSRREFDRLLEAEVRRSRRYRRPLALMLLELAPVRGERGHAVAAAARSLQSQVREGDSVARVAARRLAVLLIECKEPEPILVLERLRDTLLANLGLRAQDLAIATVSYRGAAVVSSASLLALAESHLNLARGGAGHAQARAD